MVHFTKEDYEKIKNELCRLVDDIQEGEEDVTMEMEKDGILIDITGTGEVCVTTQEFWDGAWGRGGWFTEYNYHCELRNVFVETYDENDNRVETDFDATKIECEWDN